VFVGIGGWSFEGWRGVFYPEGLAQKRELEFASRRLTSIEINATYYSTFKPASFAKWRDETPEGFVFSVKGSRYCTNRRELGGAGDAVAKFVGCRHGGVPEALAARDRWPAIAPRARSPSRQLQG
jgi:uncharacterized protein YecE (DUF72 family)